VRPLVARYEVRYAGRLTAGSPESTRLPMFKSDGAERIQPCRRLPVARLRL